MQPNPIQAPQPERRQRPLVLEPSELALDSTAPAGGLARALGLALDQRMQTVSPGTSVRARTRRGAAPFGRVSLEVGPCERPYRPRTTPTTNQLGACPHARYRSWYEYIAADRPLKSLIMFFIFGLGDHFLTLQDASQEETDDHQHDGNFDQREARL